MTVFPESSYSVMDRYGKENIPFLFVISFDGTVVHVWRKEEIPGQIEYSVPLLGMPQKSPGIIPDFKFIPRPVASRDYLVSFNKIMQHILRGDSFLINLTFPTGITTSLSLKEIYEYSSAPYKIRFADTFVCFSPETFIKISGDIISTYPMKGTIDASVPDAVNVILSDKKETAEHCTIVDLLRNDLSMVAGDVIVKRFRYIDTIESNRGKLLQVSSHIEGRIRRCYRGRIGTILSLILPAGSVTGAPKKKTVDIIRKVENYDRGFYTGVFGWFDGHNLDSAVMIRFIEKTGEGMFFKSGGGITALSIPRNEYDELIRKVYVPFS